MVYVYYHIHVKLLVSCYTCFLKPKLMEANFPLFFKHIFLVKVYFKRQMQWLSTKLKITKSLGLSSLLNIFYLLKKLNNIVVNNKIIETIKKIIIFLWGEYNFIQEYGLLRRLNKLKGVNCNFASKGQATSVKNVFGPKP